MSYVREIRVAGCGQIKGGALGYAHEVREWWSGLVVVEGGLVYGHALKEWVKS